MVETGGGAHPAAVRASPTGQRGGEPAGAGAARIARSVLVRGRPPPVPGGPGARARGGHGVRAAALRAVWIAGAAGRGLVRRDARRRGDGGGVGPRGVVPGHAGRGDVGAGAAGRTASFYSARRGRHHHRSEPGADRDFGRRAHRLPRTSRRGAARAGRGPHARSDAVIRRTKIVVTLGPATGTHERIATLIEAGANVIRVNASHGTAELRAGWIAAARRAARAARGPVAGLGDLQSPRIPVGELAPPRGLRPREMVGFAPD